MKSHTSEFKEEIKLLGKQQDVRITYTINDEQIVLSSEDINSATPNYEASLLKSVMKGLDLDSNVDIPLGTEIKFEYGLLVNGVYEYLNYGNYIVYSSEKQEDTLSYKITCYDKMLYSMKDYEHIEVTYPITIYEYLKAVCNKIGLQMKETNFANMLRQVPSELFMTVNEDGTYSSMGYTYRDVLDQIAEVTGGCICLTLDDKVEVRYINETNDTIDEEYINDTNVNFGEKYGPINSIVLARAGESDKIYKKDQNSINENGLCELMISENQFMNFNDRVDYLQELSDKLFGVEYYLNDFVSTGIMYYDLLDMYNIKIFGKTYNCLMLNDEQDITQGLEENIHTDRPETSETDYKKADTTDRKINQTYLIVDKQNKKIEAVISQIGDRSDKTTTITADIDGLNSKVSNIADLTKTTSGVGTLTLDNCANGELLQLNILGNNTVFAPLVLSDDLYLSDSLFLRDVESILIVTDEKGNATNYDLKIADTLRQKNNVRDEYILDDGRAKIIRRINQNGSIKDNEEIEDLGELHIILEQGKNTIQIKDFSAEMQAKWAQKSDLTDTFSTKVETNTKISQTASQIMSEVNKKVDEEELETKITQTSTQIMTEVNKKVDGEELGTRIEQNSEAVKLAWNQISDYIQMMIIKGNASFAVLDESKRILMALDKAGQHFYKNDGSTVFGEMGVNKEDSNSYISFAVDGEYNKDITDGMAWGIKTKSDNKYHPILYIKNFHMGAKNSDDVYGQLSLRYCDLILEGMETGIQSGNVRFYGNVFSGITFEDTNGNGLLSIYPYNSSYSGGVTGGGMTILDAIQFFKNSLGSNSFKIGTGNKYVLMTDNGVLTVANGDVLFGTADAPTMFTVHASSMAQIFGNLSVEGNVYANNISSDRRIKDNIKDCKTSALDIINKIQHKEFDKKDDGKHYKIGYIAQDMEQIDPNFVIKRPENKEKNIEERYYINELPIIATLTKAIQEQQKQIEELKKEINILKGEKNG